MVQPITTSLGRNARILSNGKRVITESFKSNNGAKTTVIRVLNHADDVIVTKMRCIYEKVLKNGRKILTRKDETHYQEKVAGTNIPKQGREYINKIFSERDVLLSRDGDTLFKRRLTYVKPNNVDYYKFVEKKLEAKKLSSTTRYENTNDISKLVRNSRCYKGKDIDKLQYQTLCYNDKGIPLVSNKFDLNEFEIFNK